MDQLDEESVRDAAVEVTKSFTSIDYLICNVSDEYGL